MSELGRRALVSGLVSGVSKWARVRLLRCLPILLLGALRMERLRVLGGDDHGMHIEGLDRTVRVLLILGGVS